MNMLNVVPTRWIAMLFILAWALVCFAVTGFAYVLRLVLP